MKVQVAKVLLLDVALWVFAQMLVRRWLQEPCVRVLRVGRVSIQILSISVYWHSSDSARQDNPRRDGNFVVVTATRQGRS